MDEKTKRQFHFENNLDARVVLECDDSISELFKKTIYSLSHDLNILQKDDCSGIVSYFLKSWKKSSGVSNLSKTLPTILTGSIVEGSSLARMFHPDKQKANELEADIMYVAGMIDENTIHCIEEIPGNTGFVKIHYSANIQSFIDSSKLHSFELLSEFENSHLVTTGELKDKTKSPFKETSCDANRYINGSKLRDLHQELKPKLDIGVEFLRQQTFVVSVERKITGPSSEILFESNPITKKEHLEKVASFYQDITTAIEEKYKYLVEKMVSLTEQRAILDCVVQALEDVEKRRVTQNSFSKLHLELTVHESEQIFQLFSKAFYRYQSDVDDWFRKFDTFNTFYNSAYLLCFHNKDSFIKTIPVMSDCVQQFLCKEIEKQAPNSKTFYTNNNLYDEINNKQLLLKVSVLPALYKKSNFEQEYALSISEIKIELQKRCKALSDDFKASAANGLSTISFDNVSCLYCSFWPEVAGEWVKRKRRWPQAQKIKNMAGNGCYLVAKQSCPGDKHRLEWRWSFSSPEAALAELRTPAMKFTYFIFKSLFYLHLKSFDDCLPSYVAKTCMLYLSETHETEWWQVNGTFCCLLELFNYLQKGLADGWLPHYFIAHLNLLKSTPESVRVISLNIVSQIISEPSKYITLPEEKLELIQNVNAEILDLYSVTKQEGCPETNKESYLAVTELFKKKLSMIASNARNSQLQKVYSLMAQEVMNHMVFNQFKLEAIGDDSPLFDLKKKYLQIQQQLSAQVIKSKNILRQIVGLLKNYCIRCNECSTLVPCGLNRYHCPIRECDYDVCLECFKISNENSIHEHPLEVINKCSILCFTQFTHIELGHDPNTAFRIVVKETKKQHDSFLALRSQLSNLTADLSSVRSDKGVVMNQMLNKLYMQLDIQVNGKVDEIFNEKPTPLDDIQLLEETIQDIKKRDLIYKLVFV